MSIPFHLDSAAPKPIVTVYPPWAAKIITIGVGNSGPGQIRIRAAGGFQVDLNAGDGGWYQLQIPAPFPNPPVFMSATLQSGEYADGTVDVHDTVNP
jgi:hypothetical protein